MGDAATLTSLSRPSVREHLRCSTAQAHNEVDRHFTAVLADGERGYSQFLRDMATAIIPLERALDASAFERVLPDWPQRKRTQALLDDLGCNSGDIALVEQPTLRSIPEAFGIAYVLEGSRLGARLILRDHLGGNAPAASRFLRHGGGRWNDFVVQLERHCLGAVEQAVAGAHLAFACFSSDWQRQSRTTP